MPPRNPQLIGVGIRGRSDAVTSQRRVNCYLDIQEENDRARVVVYGCAGLKLLTYMGVGGIRGMHAPPDHAYMYVAHGSTLYRIANDGGITNLGALETSEGVVYFASGHLNTANARYFMLTDGTSGYSYDMEGETFAKITDAEFPSNPRSCAYNNGYFIVNRGDASGIFNISATDDPTSWAALDFATAESKGDGLDRIFSYQGVLALLGGESIEYWAHTGNTAFPFSAQLGMRHDWGIAARASMAEFGDNGIALMQSSMGEAVVQLLHPAGPQTISPPDLVRVINDYDVISDAIGASFMESGHPMYLLTFPSAGKSWQFDGKTQIWGERQTGANGEAYTAAHAAVLNGTTRLGGRTTGHIYTLSPGTYTDNEDVQLRKAVMEHVHLPGNSMMRAGELWVDMEVGVGLGPQDIPIETNFFREDWVKTNVDVGGLTPEKLEITDITAEGSFLRLTEIISGHGGGTFDFSVELKKGVGDFTNVFLVLYTGVGAVIATTSPLLPEDWKKFTVSGEYPDNVADNIIVDLFLYNPSEPTDLFDIGDYIFARNPQLVKTSPIADSQAMLRVSRDKGNTWGPVHTAPMGAIGKYGARARFRRLGRGNDLTFEIAVSDPVPFVITGAHLRIHAARGSGRVG